jgi:predicted nucleic acid-binding protein
MTGRLLIATAIELDCPFVTYDERLERFARRHGRQCGLAVSTRP